MLRSGGNPSLVNSSTPPVKGFVYGALVDAFALPLAAHLLLDVAGLTLFRHHAPPFNRHNSS